MKEYLLLSMVYIFIGQKVESAWLDVYNGMDCPMENFNLQIQTDNNTRIQSFHTDKIHSDRFFRGDAFDMGKYGNTYYEFNFTCARNEYHSTNRYNCYTPRLVKDTRYVVLKFPRDSLVAEIEYWTGYEQDLHVADTCRPPLYDFQPNFARTWLDVYNGMDCPIENFNLQIQIDNNPWIQSFHTDKIHSDRFFRGNSFDMGKYGNTYYEFNFTCTGKKYHSTDRYNCYTPPRLVQDTRYVVLKFPRDSPVAEIEYWTGFEQGLHVADTCHPTLYQ